MCNKCDRAEEREPILVRVCWQCLIFLAGMAVSHAILTLGAL